MLLTKFFTVALTWCNMCKFILKYFLHWKPGVPRWAGVVVIGATGCHLTTSGGARGGRVGTVTTLGFQCPCTCFKCLIKFWIKCKYPLTILCYLSVIYRITFIIYAFVYVSSIHFGLIKYYSIMCTLSLVLWFYYVYSIVLITCMPVGD